MAESDRHILELARLQVRKGDFLLQVDDLRLNAGELLVVLGPSGSGKSTLLEALAGFARLESGELFLDGKSMKDVPPYRRPVHTCWQVGGETLFPHLSVGENAGFGLKILGKDVSSRRQLVEPLLASLGLPGFFDRKISRLSGGQRQRVAIARALAPRPPLVLLDEVTNGLDPELRSDFRQKLTALQAAENMASIYISHDLEEAQELVRGNRGRLLLLHEGRVLQCGTWEELYKKPGSVFVAKYLGPINLFPGSIGEAGFEVRDLGPLPTAPHHHSPASFYGIRPERVKIVEPDADKAILKGRILDIEQDRGALNLRVQAGKYCLDSRLWGDSFPFQKEAEVGLEWHPSDACLLDRES